MAESPPNDPNEPTVDEGAGKPSATHQQVAGAFWHGVTSALAPLTGLIEYIGAHVILVGKAFWWLFRPPYRFGNYLDSAEYIGFGSLPIVLLVGIFTGMVTALQSVTGFRDFGLESYSGGTTALALATELAPVLTALMLAGRVGAGIAAELGTMRITEQIEALESMAINPVQFLVLPRLVAAVIVAPILMLCFFLVGMAGAYLVAVVNLGVDHGQFIHYVRQFLRPLHVVHGLIKAGVFGFAVVLIGCYQGFYAKGGGRGVGIGTNRAVVAGSVAVLSLDYFLSEILLKVLPAVSK